MKNDKNKAKNTPSPEQEENDTSKESSAKVHKTYTNRDFSSIDQVN